MNPTTVRVTDKHIADGKPCSSARCPIALALHEALAAEGVQQVQGLMVDDFRVRFTHYAAPGWPTYRAELPAVAAGFINHFDGALPVKPFEFELTWREAIA